MRAGIVGGFALCGIFCFAASEAHQMTSQELEHMAKRELAIGATMSQIEGFFNRHQLSFTYDGFTDRYISNVRHASLNKYANDGVLIQFYLNKQKRLERIDIQNYTTAP